MPGILSVGRLLGGSILGFSPRSLFASNEVGGWYDPSDLTTLFQDAAGTTPVSAVEQPVGLVLDKSKGLVLGSELVTNGTFDSNTTGWAAQSGASITRDTSIFPNGGLLVTANGGANSYATQVVSGLTVGARYILSASVYTPSTNATNNRATIGVDGSGFTTSGSRAQVALNTVQTISIQFVANATSRTIYMSVVTSDFEAFGTAGSVGYFDNISVRELPGNHLSQTTSTARPVLSARVNLLTYSEQFDNAAWFKASGASVTSNTDTAPDGTTTADTVTTSAGTGISQTVTTVSGVSYATSVSIKKTTGATTFPMVTLDGSASYGQVILNTNTGVASVRSGIAGATNVVVTDQTTYWRLSFNFITDTASSKVWVYPAASTDGTSYTGNLSGSCVVWGADLRPSNAGVGLPAYQRVGAATSGSSSSAGTADYDATGFPYYLRGDGVDDHLLGPNIGNLITASDYEACVGARFNAVTTNTVPWLNQSLIADSGGYVGIGAARSTGVIGAFNYDTNADEATVAMVAPATIVLQQRHTGGNIIISTNGGTEASAASDNTGTISSQTRVLRAFESVYTNGHIYGIVIRQTPFTAGERASIRDWMNSKTKAF